MKPRVKPDVILILGMHRSGTSVMTRVMSLLGARLPKSILGKNESNTRGHWESEQLIAQHEALLKDADSSWQDWRRLSFDSLSASRKASTRDSFIDGFNQEYPALRGTGSQGVCVVKEPRVCRFSGLYLEAMDEAASSVHSVIVVRNPLEVAASLTARDKLPQLDGLFSWLTHMLEAELATRGRPRSFASYERFLNAPFETVKRLVKEIEFAMPYSAEERRHEIEGYVSPSLKRQSQADEDVELDPLARGWVSDSYKAFQVLAKNPNSNTALKTLDNVRAEYFSLIEPLAVILGHERSIHEGELNGQMQESETRLTERLEAVYKDCSQQLEQKDEHITDILSEHDALLTVLHAEHVATLEEQSKSAEIALLSQNEALAADRLEHDEKLLKQTEKSTEQIAVLQAEIDTRVARIDALMDEMDFMRGEFRSLLAKSDSKIAGLYDELAARDHALAQRSSEAAAARREIENLLASTSWKMTARFRGVINLLRGSGSRGPKTPSPKIEDQSASVRLDYKPWENDPHG